MVDVDDKATLPPHQEPGIRILIIQTEHDRLKETNQNGLGLTEAAMSGRPIT